MEIGQMTNEELEKKQAELHSTFENNKSVCYEAYIKMLKAATEYGEIDDELNKRKGKTNVKND